MPTYLELDVLPSLMGVHILLAMLCICGGSSGEENAKRDLKMDVILMLRDAERATLLMDWFDH